jgi:hypothetical protein
MYVFTVRLADADRAVYETLTLRVAQHPSESPEFLVARVLAFCLEYPVLMPPPTARWFLPRIGWVPGSAARRTAMTRFR